MSVPTMALLELYGGQRYSAAAAYAYSATACHLHRGQRESTCACCFDRAYA